MKDKAKGGDPKANLDRQIDDNLRRVFQEIVQQEVPDRFKDLIEQLRAQDARK